MVDRGKVIKGLKYCKEYFSCCDKCPYWYSGTQCVTDLANDAFDLLKEQEEQIEQLDHEMHPIVLCKVCRHYGYNGMANVDGLCYCLKRHEFPNPDWFCADGERQETE